jgi:HEPN domain-containing protein
MPHRNRAELLLLKAAQDEYALDKVANDSDAPIELFGFHAQQAVEKMLKAVLAWQGVDYPFTHDLEHLFELVENQGMSVPEKFLMLRDLMPFAVEFRYDFYPREAETMPDKQEIRKIISEFRAWVEDFLRRKS